MNLGLLGRLADDDVWVIGSRMIDGEGGSDWGLVWRRRGFEIVCSAMVRC